ETLRVYGNTLRMIATTPATAAVDSLRRWLRVNNETALLRYAAWDSHERRVVSRLAMGFVFTALIAFRLLNSFLAVCLYAGGAVLVFPLMLFVWAFSSFGSIPGIPSVVAFAKARLDALLLGSAGDIRVLIQDDAQARGERGELENAIDALAESCEEI